MASGEEKSAIEVILELPALLKRLENKIDVLDTNLKILNSKYNKQITAGVTISPQQFVTSETQQLPTAMPVGVADNKKQKQQKVSQTLTLGNIKVFSNVKTSSGKAVDGMTINVFNNENNLIRNIVTNKDGFWECRLPPGKYSIEMIHPKLKTINKEFELLKDTKTFEIV